MKAKAPIDWALSASYDSRNATKKLKDSIDKVSQGLRLNDLLYCSQSNKN